ncbi:MAG: alpha/beta hydrolase [Pirellulaceae bacterium]
MTLVRDYEILSGRLPGTRRVTVYLPPAHHLRRRLPVVFCADGQALTNFSERLHCEMKGGRIPSVVFVGVHSCSDLRAKEYIPGVDCERFAAHEQFFSDEIFRWTYSEFCVSRERESCGVFGFSNGAIFALTMGARHREKYGAVIAFSVPGSADRFLAFEGAQAPLSKFYLSAGTREKPIRTTTRAIADILTNSGFETVCTLRTAGHDFPFWSMELPEALRWSFSSCGGS